ncbi:MAG: fructosamine kinase family protein [Microthrixaceae bacterium]
MESDLQLAVEEALDSAVVASRRLGGGDVAMSFAVDLAAGRRVFAKTHADPPPGFFTTEAAGLGWLDASGSVRVPQVLAASDGHDVPLLLLEWVEPGSPAGSTEVELGRDLAGLHQGEWPTFGRPDRRTTGSRGLPNEPCESWVDFFATQRLLPLARLATDAAALPDQVCADLESVANRLEDLGGPPEAPSLLHGDLWAGNRLVDSGGDSWLIDPAAHGGHREFDLAMMRLFGGFGDACFAAYAEVYPLAPGWEDRIELHQIAPLVVHAIKFGGSYVPAATSTIGRYR